jgi:hypothetical protein
MEHCEPAMAGDEIDSQVSENKHETRVPRGLKSAWEDEDGKRMISALC